MSVSKSLLLIDHILLTLPASPQVLASHLNVGRIPIVYVCGFIILSVKLPIHCVC